MKKELLEALKEAQRKSNTGAVHAALADVMGVVRVLVDALPEKKAKKKRGK